MCVCGGRLKGRAETTRRYLKKVHQEGNRQNITNMPTKHWRLVFLTIAERYYVQLDQTHETEGVQRINGGGGGRMRPEPPPLLSLARMSPSSDATSSDFAIAVASA